MNRTLLFFIALLSVVGLGSAVGSAQTRWVHINHPKSGNFIISPAPSPAVANQANPAGPIPDPWPPSDAYRAGNGVTPPRVLHQQAAFFTPDAMRAKISGDVIVECVVEVDGSVKRVHIVKSLDAPSGLDQAVTDSAKLWTFAPGTKGGQPVPVLVTITQTFSMR